MDQNTTISLRPTRRKPLVDAMHRANVGPAQHVHAKAASSSSPHPRLPHNESFVPNGTLAVHQGIDAQQSPSDKRLSALSKEDQTDSKRNSAISNTSTNASNTNRRRKTHIGPWHLGKTIGKGGCSRVRLVQHMQTGQKGAAKIISKQVAEKARAVSMANLVEQAQYDPTLEGGTIMPFGLEREIVIMKLLNHSNIVRLYDVWENRNELYLIMEYVQGGELFDFIQNYPCIEERYVVYLFRQIIAALLYCHRIHIHHRDLKPENILIDHETMQIKLVDFGMAALQPEGKYLSTPCGSPHYAAPELLHFKAYDGSKADVWNCGVILYVMLTGNPPFNFPPDPRGTMNEHQKLHMLFAKIKAADYTMPSHISKEARDLLYRIFQPNPSKRIDIEGIWNHRFLHLYDKEFNLDPRMESWIGKRPKVNDWKPLTRRDIDREIMRNMRMLWHSEKEEILIERLVNDEPNHEKYFYAELIKHREEHLENYAGSPHMTYSTSDHQHAKTVIESHEMPPVPALRSKSQYSILNDEHLSSMQSLYGPTTSDASYDPFRASLDPVIKASRQYMNVTVHRGASGASHALRPPSIQHSYRSTAPSRVEALRRGSRVNSRRSRSSTSLNRPSSYRLSSTRPIASRSSLGSSVWASSPPVTSVRPNTAHKRAVNFSHLRRSSTASALTVRTPGDSRSIDLPSDQGQLLKRKQSGTDPNLLKRGSSPTTTAKPEHASKKEGSAETPATLRIRKPRDPSQLVDREARKVSAELEKVCQEAFFRSSITSTNRSFMSTENRLSIPDTPPSSVLQQSPATSHKASVLDTSGLSDRPLPPLPLAKETPKTFTARELAETRNRIAARFAEANNESVDYFRDVLAHLDSLLPSQATHGGRAASAPQPMSRTLDDLGYLPAISEEDRLVEADDYGLSTRSNVGRITTDPVQPKTDLSKHRGTHDMDTIRLVDPSSPTPIAPLNIRKVSGASTVAEGTVRNEGSVQSATVIRHPRKAVQRLTIFEDEDDEMQPSSPTVPTIVTTAPFEEPSKVKKRGWFKRITSASEGPTDNMNKLKSSKQKSPQRWQELDDRIKAYPLRAAGHRPHSSEATASDTSEFPMRMASSDKLDVAPKDEEGVKRGLWKLFRRRVSERPHNGKVDRGLRIGTPAEFSSSSLGQSYDIPSNSNNSIPLTSSGETQQSNWLAKLLHIRPANRLVCFQVGRGRVRQELVRLLRDWRRFGVRDVTFDRPTNVIKFRVDKSNHLKIKPVSIVVELFVVLEHGRRAQLAIARFTQAKGAASSFKRTVEVLEDVLSAKGMLVEDNEKKAAMTEMLTQREDDK